MNENKLHNIAYDAEKDLLIRCIYDSDGNLCNYYILDDKISSQLAKYNDIRNDLKEAKRAIDKLIEIEKNESNYNDKIVSKALLDFAIVTIVKCFNSSSGRKTSLDYNKIYKDHQENKDLFCKILNIRNQAIAHSGIYSNSLALYFDYKTNLPIELQYSNLARLGEKKANDLEGYKQLINYTLIEVQKIQAKLYEKLVELLKVNARDHYFKLSKKVDESTIVTTVEIDEYLIAVESLRK